MNHIPEFTRPCFVLHFSTDQNPLTSEVLLSYQITDTRLDMRKILRERVCIEKENENVSKKDSVSPTFVECLSLNNLVCTFSCKLLLIMYAITVKLIE